MLKRVGNRELSGKNRNIYKGSLFSGSLSAGLNLIHQSMETGISYIRECWFRKQGRSMSVR